MEKSVDQYLERLTVPLRWWVQGTMLLLSLWIALVVAVPERWAWALTFAAFLVMGAGYLRYGSTSVGVSDGELRAGRAHLPVEFTGEVTELNAEEMRLAAGRDADPRAFFVLRPYMKRGIKVAVTDPADPTPYWLLHAKRPDLVAKALESARS